MNKWFNLALLGVMGLSACESVSEPDSPVVITLTGPQYAVGKWVDSQVGYPPSGYWCYYIFQAKATGGVKEKSFVEWVGGTVKIYEYKTRNTIRTDTIFPGEIAGMWEAEDFWDTQPNRVYSGRSRVSFLSPVSGPSTPYSFEMSLSYYDPAAGYTGHSVVNSECRPESPTGQ